MTGRPGEFQRPPKRRAPSPVKAISANRRWTIRQATVFIERRPRSRKDAVLELADESFDFASAEFGGGVGQWSGTGQSAARSAEPGDGLGYDALEQANGKFKDPGDTQQPLGFRGSQPAGNLAAGQSARGNPDEGRDFADGNAAFGGKEFKRTKRKAPTQLTNEMGRRGCSQAKTRAGGSVVDRPGGRRMSLFACEAPFHTNRLCACCQCVNLFLPNGMREEKGVGIQMDMSKATQNAQPGVAGPRGAVHAVGRAAGLVYFRGGCGAEAGYDEANLFVGDFWREGFFEGLQAVHAQRAAGGSDLVVAFRRQPLGLKLGVASFDQVGDEGDDGAQGSLANLSNLNKRAPLFQQLEGLLGRARWFCPPTFIRAFPLPEILNRLEDLLPVHLNLLIAEAGHAPQLAQKLIQLSIDRRFSDRAGDPRLRRTCGLCHARSGAASFASIRFDFQPVRSCRAGIAIAAGLPFGFLAKVQADVALAALLGLHKTLDFAVTLPGAG